MELLGKTLSFETTLFDIYQNSCYFDEEKNYNILSYLG